MQCEDRRLCDEECRSPLVWDENREKTMSARSDQMERAG